MTCAVGRSPTCVLNLALSAARDAGIAQMRFRQVGPTRWKQIVDRIFVTFTRGGRAHRHSIWMWEDFKTPFYVLKRKHSLDMLLEFEAPTASVWFILGESHGATGGDYWLFEGEISAVIEVLKGLHIVEFYVVGHRLDWLLAENHHNMLIGVGDIAVQRLQALDEADAQRSHR